MPKFDEENLCARLAGITPESRTVFAASCATRVKPAYVAFHANTQCGDPAALSSAQEFIWSAIDRGKFARGETEKWLEAVMALVPPEDESWTELHKFADDAAAATAYALRTMLRDNPEEAAKEAAWAARRVFEAVSSYIVDAKQIDVTKRGFEELIDGDSLMQLELERQDRDVEELQRPDALKSNGSVFFRRRAERESSFRLGAGKKSTGPCLDN